MSHFAMFIFGALCGTGLTLALLCLTALLCAPDLEHMDVERL